MQDFLKRWFIVPVAILIQVFGHVESVYKFTGAPRPFLFSSVGFLLAAACLMWLVWFSGKQLERRIRLIAIGGLWALCVGYCVLVQYHALIALERRTIYTATEIESARWLIGRDPHEAIARLNRIAKRVPDIAEVYNVRGIGFYKLQRYREAYEEFKLAGERGPDNQQYEYNKATALRAMCDFTGTRDVLDTYVTQYKGDVWGRYDRGVIYQILGRDDVALADYEIVIGSRQDPSESALFNAAVIHAGRAAKAAQPSEQERSVRTAVRLLERAVREGGDGRLAKIRSALVPIEKREAPPCGVYVTDDLTPVVAIPQFRSWLQEHRLVEAM